MNQNKALWGRAFTTDPRAVKAITGADMAMLVRSVLSYDRSNGALTWVIDAAPNAPAGSVAGCRMNKGYWAVSLLGRSYLAHRLAWLHVHGDWPKHQIDHINGDRGDNRLCNLRETTNATNAQNKRFARSDNKCGLLGVRQLREKWQARIMKDGKATHLGSFDTKEAAHAAYVAAKRQLHEACTI